MKMNKKIISIIGTAILSGAALTGCGKSTAGQPPADTSVTAGPQETAQGETTQEETAAAGKEKIKVVSTIFPGYDFVRQIAGDHVELTMLLPPGAESHSFEPTPRDIINIQDADLFIGVGGHSETWVAGILESVDAPQMKVLNMMDVVDVVQEEIKDGMEHNHDHDHGHSHEVDEAEIEDRPLADWAGEWQSVYPYLLDGTLDEMLAHKAEEGDKTEAQYREYYQTGFATDVEKIVIDDHTLEFVKGSQADKAEYEYQGYCVLTNDDGEKSVRYQFAAKDEAGEAPRYIQFSDHLIKPEKSGHFHIYWGNDGFAALNEEIENWPTYFPAEMTGAQIAEEMTNHGHSHAEDEEAHEHGHEEAGEHGNEEHGHEEDAHGQAAGEAGSEPRSQVHDEEYDEHVWTSPVNSIAITREIAGVLMELDRDNAETYQANAKAYEAELQALDEEMKNAVASAKRKTLIFGDRFPFRYLVKEYGLDYYAAFPGCSTDTEASAQTVAFLINKVNEEQIPVVFHLELSNEKLADTICESTNAKKLLLHSCHNLTKKEVEGGVTYLELMKANVENLKEALN